MQTFTNTAVTSGSAENNSSPQNCQDIVADFNKNYTGTKRDNEGEAGLCRELGESARGKRATREISFTRFARRDMSDHSESSPLS